MGELLVKICKDAVQLEKSGAQKSSGRVMLAPKVMVTTLDQASKLPFVNIFEITFGPGLALAHEHGLSLKTLHEARESFVQNVRKPDSPFAWQEIPLYHWLAELAAAGQLEAYDHWLYGPGFPQEYQSWVKAHDKAQDSFAKYMDEHPLFR